ncbi:hypothetical protein FOA52_006403 [Chlamydomonas sp. UWO 241]|nr:hypothetical protein FOA52_006403 [Chlamydomonas sp. UWO 241]
MAPMNFIKAPNGAKPVHLVMAKDQTRNVKRGHPWVFQDTLASLPPAPDGSLALLKTKTGDILAKGYYEPGCPIAFRSLVVGRDRLDDALVLGRLERSHSLRQRLFSDPSTTNGFRLVNGEGDGLPGLVIDVYGAAAVVKCDGPGAAGFYDVAGIAEWLVSSVLPATSGQDDTRPCVFLKFRSGDKQGRGELVAGTLPSGPVLLLENGARFLVDIVQGQKTGFFLDQRENRALVRRLVPKGARVLNLFGYTGGFSIYAGLGGAGHVTTVDVAVPAIEAACTNWALNGLSPGAHDGRAVDAFEFLEAAAKARERWDVVVADPPSFCPSAKSVATGSAAYARLFTAAASVTAPGGLLALASCSSHMPSQAFADLCEDAVGGGARRTGRALAMQGQPPDHPFPMTCSDLRYLKFNLYQLD